MFPPATPAENDNHDDSAAFWFARMNSGAVPGLADEAAFRAWLEADPQNAASYRQCQAVWRDLALNAGARQTLALRAKALRSESGLTRRRALFGLTGAVTAAGAAGLWVMTASSPARALIVTRAGQRLTAPLPDGSQVTLAPLTRIRLDYSSDRRGMLLETGQAYFNVLPDERRPFAVIAGDQVMTSASGRFQVALRDRGSQVVVEDGVLDITGRQDQTRVLARVAAGHRADSEGAGVRVDSADVETATAWRVGRLVVRDRPLRDVVDEFNRYSSDHLVLGDDRAGAIRISGSFRNDGAEEFALALASGFDLAVARRPDGAWRIDAPEGTATLR